MIYKCPACGEMKEYEEFGRNKASHNGRQTQCKACRSLAQKKWAAENREEWLRRKREANAKESLATKANRKRLCKERYEYIKRATFGDAHARSFVYYAAQVIKDVFGGIAPHVDHIIPLRGEMVCGLHTPCNLQLLSASDNYSKRNKFL